MNALDLIKLEEGLELKPYRCPAGKLSIGYGHNLDDKGITKDEADYIFKNDVLTATQELKDVFDFYPELSEVRQAVLLNMVFNMGLGRLLGFKKMIAAIEAKDYTEAAIQILDSRAARDLPERYQRLSSMMQSDEWPRV